MTDDETIQKLLDLKLATMAQAYRDLLTEPPGNQRSFTEKIAVMVDREVDRARQSSARSRLLRAAHLTINDACLENVWCERGRGLDKAVSRDLATCQWIRKKHQRDRRRQDRRREVVSRRRARPGRVPQRPACDVHARPASRARACDRPRRRHVHRDARAPRQARRPRPRRLSLIAPLKDTEPPRPPRGPRRSLRHLVDRRDLSQVPTKHWPEMLADPTHADAICDRLVHNAHVVALKGPSGRERKDSRSSRLNQEQREASPVAPLRIRRSPSLRSDGGPGQPEQSFGSRRNERPDRAEYASTSGLQRGLQAAATRRSLRSTGSSAARGPPNEAPETNAAGDRCNEEILFQHEAAMMSR